MHLRQERVTNPYFLIIWTKTKNKKQGCPISFSLFNQIKKLDREKKK